MADEQPPTIWVLYTPFRKNGAPVMGSFGSSVKPVIVMESTTWHRLLREHPTLAAAKFRVGTEE